MHTVQQKLLDLIGRRNIGGLSLRKMSELIGGGESAQNIKHHLGQLAKKGLIRVDKRNNLIERVKSGVKTASDLIPIPILGSANCGEAVLFANETPEGHVQVSPKILGESVKRAKKLFALRAVGPSMNRADICGDSIEESDYVIVDSGKTSPKDGDYVVSVIDGCANIKRFFCDTAHKRIVLVSESTEIIPPIYIHQDDYKDFLINGCVVLVMKSPDDLSQFLQSSSQDTFGSLPSQTQEEYDYYSSLPSKK